MPPDAGALFNDPRPLIAVPLSRASPYRECQDSPILLCLTIRSSGVSAPPTEIHFSVIRSAQVPMHR